MDANLARHITTCLPSYFVRPAAGSGAKAALARRGVGGGAGTADIRRPIPIFIGRDASRKFYVIQCKRVIVRETHTAAAAPVAGLSRLL